jgi:hypothetical protein
LTWPYHCSLFFSMMSGWSWNLQTDILHSYKSINQITIQHNYPLNKFITSVETTCFGSFQWAILRPYTVS